MYSPVFIPLARQQSKQPRLTSLSFLNIFEFSREFQEMPFYNILNRACTYYCVLFQQVESFYLMKAHLIAYCWHETFLVHLLWVFLCEVSMYRSKLLFKLNVCMEEDASPCSIVRKIACVRKVCASLELDLGAPVSAASEGVCILCIRDTSAFSVSAIRLHSLYPCVVIRVLRVANLPSREKKKTWFQMKKSKSNN